MSNTAGSNSNKIRVHAQMRAPLGPADPSPQSHRTESPARDARHQEITDHNRDEAPNAIAESFPGHRRSAMMRFFEILIECTPEEIQA